MKIHILFEFVDGPWGGGNQFLKGLRRYLESINAYADAPADADAILFNSHHRMNELLSFKKHYREKIFVHRVDGPVYLIRGCDREIDNLVFAANQIVADGTIFQSRWSMTKCFEQGLKKTSYSDIILNAPDPAIFYPKRQKHYGKEKIRLIATSWSYNVKKGFDIYRFLDENLDYASYEFTFAGNSPIRFKNIRQLGPLDSFRLAEEIRGHDIFITSSIDDPCSNSLIEALHCGLPAVVRNSGGHPEIIRRAGVVFNDKGDVLAAIDKLAGSYQFYASSINLPHMDETGDRYYKLIEGIYTDFVTGRYSTKSLTFVKLSKIKIRMGAGKALSRLKSCLHRFSG